MFEVPAYLSWRSLAKSESPFVSRLAYHSSISVSHVREGSRSYTDSQSICIE